MKKNFENLRWGAAALVIVIAGTGIVLADDDADDPKNDDLHGQLLERYGDDGIDANGDGTLTPEEIRAFFQERKGDREDWGPGRGPGFGPHGEPGMMMMIGMMTRMVDGLDRLTVPAAFTAVGFPRADVDQDGAISDDEWIAFARTVRKDMLSMAATHHPEFDSDKDGILNDEEFEAFKDDFLSQAREAILRFNPEADEDGDGVLSESEMRAVHEDHLERMRSFVIERHPGADVDGDGQLSDDEMFVHSLVMAREFRHRGGPETFGGPGKGRGFHGGRSQVH